MIQGTHLKIPVAGDRGSVFGPAISENFETLDTHNHDGNNSPLITSKSIVKSSVNLLSANWVDTGTDYRQLVTLPGGYEFDTSNIKAIITSGTYIGNEFLPTITKVSSTTFYLHCMYGNVDVKVVIS